MLVMWLLVCLLGYIFCLFVFFVFKQKTAYEMRISDWSSDVCSSDLHLLPNYDEYLIAYKDYTPALDERLPIGSSALDDVLARHIIVMNGRRSEERRVGKECVSTCRSRWSPYT